MPVRLSVIIPTYQRRALLERLLRSLFEQTLASSDFEVIVVVDGSQDGTRELLAGLAAPFRLRGLWQNNQGSAAARNAGLAAAEGEVVVILDDDMQAAPGLLAAHLGAHAGQPHLGVVGPAPMRTLASAHTAGYMRLRYERVMAHFEQPGYVIPAGEFYGGNFSARRTALASAGGFDARTFAKYGAEDMDLAHRLILQGMRLVYCHEALAYQDYDKNLASLLRDTRSEGRAEVALVSKYPELWPETRLCQYAEPGRGLRAARTALLWLGRVAPGFPEQLARLLNWLEGHSPPWPERLYVLAQGYYYWLGALEAIRANQRAGRGLRQVGSAPVTPETTAH
jgi:glycosyltransferase involved in cell wall biosynthesis